MSNQVIVSIVTSIYIASQVILSYPRCSFEGIPAKSRVGPIKQRYHSLALLWPSPWLSTDIIIPPPGHTLKCKEPNTHAQSSIHIGKENKRGI